MEERKTLEVNAKISRGLRESGEKAAFSLAIMPSHTIVIFHSKIVKWSFPDERFSFQMCTGKGI
jgi:hypothetical protein